MSWFDRLRNHARSNDVSSEIQREMEFHLAERADDLVAHGMSAGAAQREARRRFGNVTAQRERTREIDLLGWLDSLVGDLRYAIRTLRSAPAFTTVAILSLALGIGANTAIFSIVNAVMLKSLPVSHPEELVAVERDKESSFTNPLWEAIRDRQDMFSGLFAVSDDNVNLASGGEVRRVRANWVSGGFFSTLGIHAEAGRLLGDADDARGCSGGVVIAYGFWQSEYGGANAAIGRPINIDGHPLPIIGVADRRFSGINVGVRPQVYLPLCAMAIVRGTDSPLAMRTNWFLQIIGRPKPGQTPATIAARFKLLAPQITEATLPQNWPAQSLRSYRDAVFATSPAEKGFSDLRATYEKALVMLMAIVGLVLLVACANVANLLLARSTSRQREMAVRLALGAGRGRLARQLVTESLLLALTGAALGTALAAWGSRVLVGLLSRTNQIVVLDLTPDLRVLSFTLAVAVGTAVMFGLVPAWRAGRVDPQSAMKAGGRGSSDGRGHMIAAKALVAAQVALSLVLVVGAGLLLTSWRRLATADPGFRSGDVLLVNTNLQGLALERNARDAAFDQLVERIRALPGVGGAAVAQLTPVGRGSWNARLIVDGHVAKSKGDALTWVNAIGPGFFATLGVPLLAGRDFARSDTKTSTPVAIVNEALAKRFFGGGDVVGRRFRVPEGRDLGPPVEIVGVVGDTKYRSLRDSAQAIVYFPHPQASPGSNRAFVLLRSSTDASVIAPQIRTAIAQVDPRISIEFTPLKRQLDDSMTLTRAVSSLAGVFGALALLLATIGLYGIMAYTVARRRNELGVRIALGAGQSRVMRMVLGDASRIVVIGAVVGGAFSLAATKLVASFLYGVKPNDPVTLAGSAGVLLLVGIVAAALPAWRAASVDPVEALRE